MISVPAGVTSVEKRAVRDAALKAGAKEAFLIEEPLAAAIGANVPISGPSGNMIIDIGGGTSEIAVIALGGIVVSTLACGSAATSSTRRSRPTSARSTTSWSASGRPKRSRSQIGTALPLERELTMEVRGRDLIAGLPRTIPITSSEVMEAIELPLQQLVAAVRTVLEQTPPELSLGHHRQGHGHVRRRLAAAQHRQAADPGDRRPVPRRRERLNCVALGTGLALEHFDFFKKSLVQQI